MKFYFLILQIIVGWQFAAAGTKSQPHPHQGKLHPYDGKHISYRISLEDNAKLENGKPVIVNERSGKDGRGLVIQDVHASPQECMNQIRNLENYPKVVSNVKKVSVYETRQHANGTVSSSAEFSVGVSLLTFGYYLQLTFEPKYYTMTWTLDYRYSSDFDDTTGHWQVMMHPTKKGWTRILYSTEVKLPSWIPEFVITFLTKTALVESTGWVKREAEKAEKANTATKQHTWLLPDVSNCFIVDSESARYETQCIEAKLRDEL